MTTGTKGEELALLAGLEELFAPHVGWIALPMAQSLAIDTALRPLPEEDVRTWSMCFAALALCDGRGIGEAKREAKRVRDLLRRPQPPTVDEVNANAREILRLETRALVRDWLAALSSHAAAHGGRLSRADLDASMLPPLKGAARDAFVGACAARLLGFEVSRDVLMLQMMSLEDPDLKLPHDAVRWLALKGVAVVP